jgi:hypothetical protein
VVRPVAPPPEPIEVTTTNLSSLAHHEAGNAALADLFGLQLYAVWIDTATGDGGTQLALGESPTPLQHALVLLAGGRAEKVLDLASNT